MSCSACTGGMSCSPSGHNAPFRTLSFWRKPHGHVLRTGAGKGRGGGEPFGWHRRQCGAGSVALIVPPCSDRERVPFPRVSCAGACARAGARIAAARFARLIARARQRAHLSRRLLTGFQKSGAARPRNARDAAPDAASLGTIITHSARCQAQIMNKNQLYQISFMLTALEGLRSGRRRCLANR